VFLRVGHHLLLDNTWSSMPREPHVAQQIPLPSKEPARVKAVLLALVRNEELEGMLSTIKQIEERFNNQSQHHYPYVFLNNVPFPEAFKAAITQATSSQVQFGLIAHEHWSYPAHINQTLAAEKRKTMHEQGVIYGGSESYRHMCRFNSGFFYRHPLLTEYEYYWRIEPNVVFPCQIPGDPFALLKAQNKLYGFTISLVDYVETIPTLWQTTREFMRKHPQFIPANNTLGFVTDLPDMTEYNRCHFWSNFEIASLALWRSEAYTAYFDYLDTQGGFFYERWGDAPVHSLAVAMFLPAEQVHFFEDIAYAHAPFMHCPRNVDGCACNVSDMANADDSSMSCLSRWLQ